MDTSIPKSTIFRLENLWLRNNSFQDSVAVAWNNSGVCSDAAGQLAACLKAARTAAKVWARRNRAPPQLINNYRFLIHLFDVFEESRPLSTLELQVRQDCSDGLAALLKEKAAYWRQRSKNRAIREGDANTAFHHAQATMRWRNNAIKLVEVNGSQISNHAGKSEALTAFFRSIIGESGSSVWHFDAVSLFAGQPRPNSMTTPFTQQEALLAIRGMKSCSAPGPDGFGPAFYKSLWDSVKVQTMLFLESFCAGTLELERVNRSFMVLIPKKPGAVAVDAFRPICLQNCSVKIIAKILTSRLQKEISALIDPLQTGFIQGRSISETFVFAAELVQVCFKRKIPALVLKLDFAKAFDTVNWDGLFCILRARGFAEGWISWIRMILSSSKSAVLVNGCPGPWITCRRGLRQGDPLSPYLFILVAETLQKLIQSASVDIQHPVDPLRPGAVLQYADDTLIVLKGDLQGVNRLKQILDQFAGATGLSINFGKSKAVPIHMPEPLINSCVEMLGCRREGFPQVYLGLPLSTQKLPSSAFLPYISKTDRYLATWQASLLNTMGRSVLVNSVLDSQLVYVMSSMSLPPKVVQEMDKRRRGFLWAGAQTASGAKCLMAWDKVCTLKEHGGLGTKDLGTQNVCLLLKLIHKLHNDDNSAWGVWVRQHACLATLQGDLHGDHWSVLRSLLPLYQAITTVQIADGSSTSFWLDVWSGDDALADRFPILYSFSIDKAITVRDAALSSLEGNFVRRLSLQARDQLSELQEILAETLLTTGNDLRLSPFSVNKVKLDTSALYRMLKSRGAANDPSSEFIWGSSAPPRVKLFLWLMMHNRTQCRLNLCKKGIVDSTICEICTTAEESTDARLPSVSGQLSE